MDNKNGDGSLINSGGKTGYLATISPITALDHSSAPTRTPVPSYPKPWIPPSHG